MKSRQSACRDLRTDMVNTFDGSPVSAFAYAYDAAGRRTQRVDSGLTTNLFGYNMKSELADAIMGTNIYAYLYDPIGNRQLASVNEVTNLYQANELNQYTNVNAGAVEPVYDADGNMTQLGPWAYDWDGENRLNSVSSNGVPVVQNQYDYMSRRVMKATATQTNTFLYDGWNLIREEIEAGTPTSRSYVWGLDLSGTLQGAGGVGGLLVILSPDSGLLTPAYDANGNITDLVDTNGAVVAHYEYDPYGNSIAQSGIQADTNPFRFSSKYWDGETGFYYYGYRYYSPSIGRFLSRDPVEDAGFYPNLVLQVELAKLRARIQAGMARILSLLREHVGQGADTSLLDVEETAMRQVSPDITRLLYAFLMNNPINLIDLLGLDSVTCYDKGDIPGWLWRILPDWAKKALNKTCCGNTSLCVSVIEIDDPNKEQPRKVYGFGIKCKF